MGGPEFTGQHTGGQHTGGQHTGGRNFGGRVGAFDARAERGLERVRGRRLVDATFKQASAVGDFSLVWHAIGLAYGLGVRRDLNSSLAFSALIGLESLLLNQGIKRLFRRQRPTEAGDPRFPVRKPATSSFPSGHASSAAFAASILTVWAGVAWAPLWFFIAFVVGTSRAFVRVHHASDVVAGFIVGAALAQLALLVGAAELLG